MEKISELENTTERWLSLVDLKVAIAYIFLLSREKANDFSFSKEFANISSMSYFKEKTNWSKLKKLELERRGLIIEKEGRKYLNLGLFSGLSFAPQFFSIIRRLGFNKPVVYEYLKSLEKSRKNGYILILEFYISLLQELESYLPKQDILRKTKNKDEWLKHLKLRYKNNFLNFNETELENITKEFESLKTEKPLDKLIKKIDQEIKIIKELMYISDKLPRTLEDMRLKRSWESKTHPKGRFKQSDYIEGFKKLSLHELHRKLTKDQV